LLLLPRSRRSLLVIISKQNTKMKKTINCKNCNTKFEGNFCNNCGEKVVNEGDFGLKKIFSQALDSFTHLDSKLFKTLKLLLFYPGKLSKLYVEGVRVPYMKPFQIFIIINVIFFILFSNDDIFRVPSDYFFKENYDGVKTMEKVREIANETGLSETEIAIQYDNTSRNLAKGLLVFLIPIIALFGKLFNGKQKMELGKHFIFSIHLLTFILTLFVFSSLFFEIATSNTFKKIILIIIGLGIAIYYSIAQKSFYNNTWRFASIKGTIGTILIFVLFSIYKMLISVVALYTI
jgi:hypothetical protein